MTNNDRLIEILQQKPFAYSDLSASRLADRLIAKGVIVPPCKVGDTVYCLIEDDIPTHRFYLSSEKVVEVCSKGFFTSAFFPAGEDLGEYTSYTEIGDTVFLTKEEAERALNRRS